MFWKFKGCGAFGGDKELKAVIQWLAASCAGRELIYCTFNDTNLNENLESFVHAVQQKSCTIENVFQALLQIAPKYIKDSLSLPSTFTIVSAILRLDFKSTREDAAVPMDKSSCTVQ